MIGAFDLATSGNFKDICYGVAIGEKPVSFFTKDDNGKATVKMSPLTIAKTLVTLDGWTRKEDMVLCGWGSLGFDCKLLYEESGKHEEAVELAYSHLDLMWVLMAHTGFFVSLAEVGAYYKVPIDPGMGKLIPTLWKGSSEDRKRVALHQRSQVEAIHKAGNDFMHRGCLHWVDKKTGKECLMTLPNYKSNRPLLRLLLAVPSSCLSKPVADSIEWIRST